MIARQLRKNGGRLTHKWAASTKRSKGERRLPARPVPVAIYVVAGSVITVVAVLAAKETCLHDLAEPNDAPERGRPH